MVIRASSPPLSRSTLLAVVAAHIVVVGLALTWSVHLRPAEPEPLMVTLMSAPAEPDVLPAPLPVAAEPVAKPEPVREVPVKPTPKVAVVEPTPTPLPEVKPVEPEPAVEPPPVPPPVELPKPITDVPAPPAPVPPPVAVAAAPIEATPVAPPVSRPEPPKSIAEPARPPAAPVASLDSDAPAQAWNADYLRNPKPAYPSTSRRLGERGTVLLRVLVTVAGEPAKVEVKTTSGFPRLDDSALEAVRQWKFVPARLGDHPVEAWVVVPIKFSLKG